MAMARRRIDTGWSQSGSLITFNPNRAIVMQCPFPSPGAYTIQFGIVPRAVSGYRPEALISWNVKGNQITRRITVGNGTSITGQAEAVIVKLFDSLIAGSFGTPGEVYDASIQVSKGSRASAGQQAPIFQPITAVNNGVLTVINATLSIADTTTCIWAIPEGATQVIAGVISGPVATVLDNSDVTMAARNAAGIMHSWFPLPGQWMPLPPLATEVSISNRSGQVIDANILFGIDG